ncbi:hypothetical protein ACJJIP_13790 [Microbulbifer sp. VTAC004]|uniref:hypothetical protein n=1 Tax=unclassified Microbulbifer TaxID=2619833 RepID=UPI00403A3641
MSEAAAGSINGNGDGGLNEPGGSGGKFKAPVNVDESVAYSSRSEALAAADASVAAMGDAYEWSSFVVEKGGLYYTTHPTTSLLQHGVRYDGASLQRLYDDGFSIKVVHHNHPTNPYFSDSDRNFSGGVRLSNMTTNSFVVTLRHGNSFRYVTSMMSSMSDRAIRQNYGLTSRQVKLQKLSGRIVKGQVCNNYGC